MPSLEGIFSLTLLIDSRTLLIYSLPLNKLLR